MKFAHIAPTSMAPMAHQASDINLVLAHLVGDNKYTKFYAGSSMETIMDNGAFELGESISPELLIEKAKLVNATYIVLPDYPGQHWEKTVNAAKEYIPKFKEAGFKTFFAPQSEVGDYEGYMQAWDWAIANEDIDLIGCSILGAPNATGGDTISARYKVLRYLQHCVDDGVIDYNLLDERVHMLGMLDTVHEICLVKPFHWMINSWDTSAAVWYGMNGKLVAETSEKFKRPVDFDAEFFNVDIAAENLAYINNLR